jgi:hypothetical protein
VVGACRSDEAPPAPAPAEAPAPAASAEQPPRSATAAATPEIPKPDAAPVPAPGRKEVVAATFEELYCANRREEGADLLPVYDARGFETPSAFAREMDALAAEDPEWARGVVERAVRDGCP